MEFAILGAVGNAEKEFAGLEWGLRVAELGFLSSWKRVSSSTSHWSLVGKESSE